MSDCTPSPSLSPREGAENDDGALPAVSPTTEGGIHSFHNRLVRIYMAYDPAKAHTVSGTLRKYRGREEAVIQKLVEKYGPEPPYSSSEEMNLSPRPATTEVSEVSSQPSPRGLTNSFPAPPPLPQSYVERLTSMYAHYDPDKVRLVEGTLRKFRGKEEAVMQQLIKKYGPEPLASPVEVNRTTTSMDGEADSMASPIALVSSSAAAPSEEVDRSEEAAVDGDAVVAAASEEEGHTTSSDLTPATDYYRTHMMELLQRHEPDKVDMIDELLSKYQGREQEMLDRLTLRFNGPPPTEAEVDEPTAVTMEDASPPPLVAPPPPPIQQHQPGIDVGVQRVGAPTNNTSISRVQLFSVDPIPPPPVVVVVEPPQSPKVEKRAQHTQTVTVAVAAPRVVQWSRPGLAWITHQAMERHKALLRRYWVLWAAHHNTNTLVRRQVWKAVEGGRRYQMNDHVEPPYVVSRIPLGPRGDGSAFSSSMVAALRKLVDALRQCIRGQVTEMMSAEHRKQAELFLASWSTKKDLAPVRDGEALHRAIVQASMLLGQMKELMAVVKKQAAQLQESSAQRAASDKKVAEMTQFQQHFQQARAVVQELQASLQRAEEEKTSMQASLDAARSSARAASIRPSPITSSSFTPSPAPTPRDATTYAAQRPQWPRSLSSPRPPQHRGLCSTCGSELASCCPETEGPRNKKAAFCFKCRRSFTFGEL